MIGARGSPAWPAGDGSPLPRGWPAGPRARLRLTGAALDAWPTAGRNPSAARQSRGGGGPSPGLHRVGPAQSPTGDPLIPTEGDVGKRAAAIKIPRPLVDLEGVADPEDIQQLANSMLGALLAVAQQSAGDLAVNQILARAGERRSPEHLQQPGGWSSYQQGLALFQAAADVLGDPDIGRKAGEEVFRRYSGTEVLALLRSIGSPSEMLRVYPAISAKRSTITRSEVVEVGEEHGLIRIVTPDYERDPCSAANRGRPVTVSGAIRNGTGPRRGGRMPDPGPSSLPRPDGLGPHLLGGGKSRRRA